MPPELDSPVTTDAPETAASDAPAGDAAAASDAPAAPTGTADAIAAARERIKQGQPLVPEGTPDAEAGASAEGATEGEGEEEAGEEEAASEFTVTLEGMAERGEPEAIELEAPDQETYQILNRLQNEAKVGREVKQHQRTISRQQEELAQAEDTIEIDPAGFVLEHVTPEVRTDVAMQLLFEPGVMEAIQQRLAQSLKSGALAGVLEADQDVTLADLLQAPAAVRTLRAELKADRLQLREKLRTQTEQRRAMAATAQRVAAEVDRLIPDTITGESREQLFRDALRDIKERCDRLGLTQIDPSDVALLVSERFRRQGIDLSAVRTRGVPANGSAPAGAAAPAAGRTAEQFRQAREARRTAAAAAPAGAGAPSAKPRPELPKTTKERIQLARKVGLRKMLGLP